MGRRNYTPSEAYELLPRLREQPAKIERFISGLDSKTWKEYGQPARAKFPFVRDTLHEREVAVLQEKLVGMRAKARAHQKKIERDIAKAEKAVAAYDARVQAETKAEATQAAIQPPSNLSPRATRSGWLTPSS